MPSAPTFSVESVWCRVLVRNKEEHYRAVNPTSFVNQAGSVVSCVGSLRDVVLQLAGGYDHKLSSASSPEEWEQQQLQQEGLIGREQHVLRTAPRARFEVLSLSGTLSPDGIRVSVCLGDEQGAVCGGHLVSAVVDTSVELVIGHAPKLVFSRRRDSATGFKELVVSRNGMSLCEALLVTFVIMILCYLVMAALLISFGS